MSDWQVSGPVSVISPGYNSNYAVRVGKNSPGYFTATFKNVAYSSDAFMLILYMRGSIYCANSHLAVGHTGYGKMNLVWWTGDINNPIANPIELSKTEWAKYRIVFYFNYELGVAIGVVEKWDETNNQWVAKRTATFRNVTNPVSGNIYFEAYLSNGSSGCHSFLDIDEMEFYTGKSLDITLAQQETETVSQSTS